MPKEKVRFSVLNDLQELAKESDRLAELIPQTTILDDYLALWKATVLEIKTCTSVKDIVYPPDIKTAIFGEQRVIKTVNDEVAETDRAHVHAEKNVIIGNRTSDIKSEKNQINSQVIQSKDKDSTLKGSIPVSVKGESVAVIASCKKINQETALPEIKMPKTETATFPVKIVPQINSDVSQKLMETPIMNRTFNKLINNTFVLNSASSQCSDLRITRSGSKRNLQNGGTSSLQVNNTEVMDSASSQYSDLRITRSGSKQKLQNGGTSSFQMLTQTGSKRKSSPSQKESSKKLKSDKEISNSAVSISATKAVKSKKPLKKNVLKPVPPLVVENKSKAPAVIVPTMKHNLPVAISKEKQIMEEIQKKEEKANENRKKVLAERQQKAEQSKKKRNEKMEKTLQKRLMIEKEKEERLEKKENEPKKPQANSLKESINKPVLKLRTKELIDQHLKENNSTNSSTPKQNDTNGGVVLTKTPVKNLSPRDSETYELTPVPDSSTYDFSDDDDEKKPAGKPIPSWAQGVHLRLALTHQFYNPPDTDAVFGSYIEMPNLTEIFRVQKKQYLKRTSSAVWKTPPDRSFCR